MQEENDLLKYSNEVQQVEYMYACEWEIFKKQNPLTMEMFWFDSQLLKDRPMKRLVARHSLRGGVIEVFRLKFDVQENVGWKLWFLDCNSLYSFIAASNPFPIGPYKIIIDRKDILKNVNLINGKYFYRGESMSCDVALVTILPPTNLKRPYLGFLLNDEFNFYSLCHACVAKKITSTCPHRSNKVRAFTSTYTLVDIEMAVSLKYEVLSFHEIHHYSKTDFILKDYVKVLAAEKIKHSDILKNVQPEKQKEFCDELNAAMEFEEVYKITPENVTNNASQRSLFKSLQNNFFGRHALHSNYRSYYFCKTLRDIQKRVCKQNVEMSDIFVINENICQIEVSESKKIKPSLIGNLYITSIINALARKFIYEQSMIVESNFGVLLSIDTDSLTFALPTTSTMPLKISDKIGDFKHVLKEDCKLLSFHSLAPRNYSIVYENAEGKLMHHLKIKGLSLTSNNCNELITSQLYSEFVTKSFQNDIQKFYLPQMRKKCDKQTKKYDEILTTFNFGNEIHVKRYIIQNNATYETYPYGYKFNM